jgi:hypothetical protein
MSDTLYNLLIALSISWLWVYVAQREFFNGFMADPGRMTD